MAISLPGSGGLDKNKPQLENRLINFSALSPIAGTINERLSVTVLEEVYYWAETLRFKKTCTHSLQPPTTDQIVSSHLLLLLCLFSLSAWTLTLWNCKLKFKSCFICCLFKASYYSNGIITKRTLKISLSRSCSTSSYSFLTKFHTEFHSGQANLHSLQ